MQRRGQCTCDTPEKTSAAKILLPSQHLNSLDIGEYLRLKKPSI